MTWYYSCLHQIIYLFTAIGTVFGQLTVFRTDGHNRSWISFKANCGKAEDGSPWPDACKYRECSLIIYLQPKQCVCILFQQQCWWKNTGRHSAVLEDLLSNLAKVYLGQRDTQQSKEVSYPLICESELPSTNKSNLYFVKMFRVISSFSGTCTVF